MGHFSYIRGSWKVSLAQPCVDFLWGKGQGSEQQHLPERKLLQQCFSFANLGLETPRPTQVATGDRQGQSLLWAPPSLPQLFGNPPVEWRDGELGELSLGRVVRPREPWLPLSLLNLSSLPKVTQSLNGSVPPGASRLFKRLLQAEVGIPTCFPSPLPSQL